MPRSSRAPAARPGTRAYSRPIYPVGFQYGLGVKAYVLNLLTTRMISLNRAQALLKALIGRALSEARMLKYVWQLHQALEQWEQTAIESLLAAPVMHVDETALRLNKKNHWVHVFYETF